MLSKLVPISYRDGYIELEDGFADDSEMQRAIEAIGDDYEVIESGLKGWPGDQVVKDENGCYYIV